MVMEKINLLLKGGEKKHSCYLDLMIEIEDFSHSCLRGRHISEYLLYSIYMSYVLMIRYIIIRRMFLCVNLWRVDICLCIKAFCGGPEIKSVRELHSPQMEAGSLSSLVPKKEIQVTNLL